MDLKERREQWEKGLEVKTEISPNKQELLVVLEHEDRRESDRFREGDFYHCHRYFMIGDDWEISVDGQNVTLDKVWKWLKDFCPFLLKG